MQVDKYYIVRYKFQCGDDHRDMYYKGYNRWTRQLTDAKFFKDTKAANRIAKIPAPGGNTCELLYVTLKIEDTNDLLEKELLF